MSDFLGTFAPLHSSRKADLIEPCRVQFPGGCRVLFHGHVANRRELCRTLSLTDSSATTDAEMVAHCYRRFGENLQTRIFGEYAFALLDTDANSLLLSHDALGVCPLFYSQTSEGLTFATSLQDMVQATGVGKLDEDYLADLLAGADPGEATPYQHIRRLGQGYSLVARAGSVRRFRDYNPSRIKPLQLKNPSEYEEMCRALVEEAVAGSLPSKGKVWCELSGGLDSSTIVSVAAGTLRRKVETFSIVFSRSGRADESRWIDTVLQSYPLRSHRVDADSVPPFSEMPDRFYAEPTGAILIAAYDSARKALLREHSVDIVLTGSCGDALFFGDSPRPFHLADQALKRPFQTLRQVGDWARGTRRQRSCSYWFAQYVLEPRLRRLMNRTIAPAAPLPRWISPEYAKKRHLKSRGQRRRLFGLSILDEYFWHRMLRGALLASRAHPSWQEPCSYRNPLLYLPLVEFMAAVPWHEKLQADEDRYLQRRALQGILPEPTRLRRGKRGPAQALLAGLQSSEGWVNLLTKRSALVERGYLDPKRWCESVNLARFGSCESIPEFLKTCALEAWFSMLDRAPVESK